MAKKKKSTQVALAPLLGKGLLYGGAFAAGKAAEKFIKDYRADDEEKEEKKKKSKKKPIKKLPDGVKSIKVRKGGLIKVKRGDGIAKKGKTKCRMR